MSAMSTQSAIWRCCVSAKQQSGHPFCRLHHIHLSEEAQFEPCCSVELCYALALATCFPHATLLTPSLVSPGAAAFVCVFICVRHSTPFSAAGLLVVTAFLLHPPQHTLQCCRLLSFFQLLCCSSEWPLVCSLRHLILPTSAVSIWGPPMPSASILSSLPSFVLALCLFLAGAVSVNRVLSLSRSVSDRVQGECAAMHALFRSHSVDFWMYRE